MVSNKAVAAMIAEPKYWNPRGWLPTQSPRRIRRKGMHVILIGCRPPSKRRRLVAQRRLAAEQDLLRRPARLRFHGFTRGELKGLLLAIQIDCELRGLKAAL